MKVLLVSPEYPDTFWNFRYALKFISKKANLPPLGLLTVAAMLPKEWEKKLVDMMVATLSDRDIRWADFVFIGATSIQKESVKRIIAKCKVLGVKIVAGGPLFTAGYGDFENVDHLVLNEAEVTLPPFLKDLQEGHPKHIYASDERADVKNTPIPLWELVDMKKYATMCIQYSRGCPYSCEFCDIPVHFGHNMRAKAKEQVLAEFESLYSQGWRGGVFIVDDNFIGNKKELKKAILPSIVAWMNKRSHPFSFTTQASIDLSADEELMQLMVQAGFDSVFVGIESPNEESLTECGKYQNKNRDLIACVKRIQRSSLQVQAGFIVGFDSDPPTVFDRLIAFIQESGIATAMVGLLNAPRGTRLYQRLVKEERLLKDISGDNTDLTMNFIPKMNYEVLVNGYKRIIHTIYSPQHYYERVLMFLRNFEQLQKKRFRFQLCHLRALLKSIWFLGISGKGRVYYWRLLLWSLIRHPQLFPLTVTLSIYGFHFRKIFEKY